MKSRCLNPYVRQIPQLVTELGMPVLQAFPCGKCPICVQSDARDWMLRLSVEQAHSFSSHFITLTYNEKNIVRNGSVGVLVKRDIQLFLKRLRQRIADKFSYSPKLRFFVVGEYGPTTHRPHYHLIIFNLPSDINLHRLIEDCWNKGFVTISDVNSARISYLASYSLYGFLFSELKDDIQPPFRLMSRRPGIGNQFVTPATHRYYNNNFDYIRYKGYSYRFPRFYRDRIFDSVESREMLSNRNLHYRDVDFAIYESLYGELDKARLMIQLPIMQEEFDKMTVNNLKKQYVQHKLHRKL